MELATSFMKIAVLVVFIAIGFSLYLTDFISRPIVEMTESLNKMIEAE
jgi:nitrogen fixation/metabolism regulation signal transduction histidine kinase